MTPRVNPELLQLFRADQADREQHPPFDSPAYHALLARDAQRRLRVLEIIEAGQANSPQDLYYAALVLHHGGDLPQVRMAHTLAKSAAEQGYRPARWLTAATLDRWLMMQGRPQKYGTQIVPDGQRQRVWDVDPATTDEERAAWDVRPLRQQHARAAELTRTQPMPPMERAPNWLKAAIRRWQKRETPP
ncbi:MAG: hypothetical protein Kow0031_28800 [Anaerolineae bacterium]